MNENQAPAEGQSSAQTGSESLSDAPTCSAKLLIHFSSRDALLEMLCQRVFGAFPAYDDDPIECDDEHHAMMNESRIKQSLLPNTGDKGA